MVLLHENLKGSFRYYRSERRTVIGRGFVSSV